MRAVKTAFMFNFGGPEQTAAMLWDAVSTDGPGIANAPLDEMDFDELQAALVYARTALYEAMADKQPDDVVEVCLNQFEEIFRFYIPLDPAYAKKILEHKLAIPSHRPRRYWALLAREILSES